MSEPTEDLRERAREHVRQMPAETALGNADPTGGSTDDPQVMDEAARDEGQPSKDLPPPTARGLAVGPCREAGQRSPRSSSRPRGLPSASCPRSQVRRTTPVSSRPA